jgi:hypothetical protein
MWEEKYSPEHDKDRNLSVSSATENDISLIDFFDQ